MIHTILTSKVRRVILLFSILALLCSVWSCPEQVQASGYASLDLNYHIRPAEGFSPSAENMLRVELYNNGNTAFRDAMVTLGLPEGILPKGLSATESAGSMAVGDKKILSFPLEVEKGLEAKTYPLTVQVTASGYMGESFTTSKTFYIPVEGVTASDLSGIEITNIQIPGEVTAGENFSLSFTVTNKGSRAVSGMKITAAPPEGVYNLSRSAYVDDFNAGQSRTYRMTFASFDDLEAKGCAIKLSVSPSGNQEEPAVSQYAATDVKNGAGTVKSPLLMISSVSYGGSVQAGSSFRLHLTVKNTSDKKLTNIKLALSAEGSTFLPAQGSSTLFLDSIEAKSSSEQSMLMSAKADAEQRPTGITVSMSYEDGRGNAYTAEDTISIPVVQKDRLSVGDVTPPYEAYAGNICSGEIEFYNKGKSVLNNLSVRAEGNFDSSGMNNNYYVGNMASGASDSFSFNMLPREAGPVQGEIIFSYEDGTGKPCEVRKTFSFEAMEMPAYEEPFPMDEQSEKALPWSIMIAGAVLLLLIGMGVFIKIRRKRRLEKSLELDDEYGSMGLE